MSSAESDILGGTVLGQALWSAVEEHQATHTEIIQLLIESGAGLEPGTLEWWNEQDVPDASTKEDVSTMLRSRQSSDKS